MRTAHAVSASSLSAERPVRISSAIMVREGLTLAFTRYGADHVADQQRARAGRRGVRARNCAAARDYRTKSRATVLP